MVYDIKYKVKGEVLTHTFENLEEAADFYYFFETNDFGEWTATSKFTKDDAFFTAQRTHLRQTEFDEEAGVDEALAAWLLNKNINNIVEKILE